MMANQGHRYRMGSSKDVLALESGEGVVRVAEIDTSQPWGLGRPEHVPAQFLSPLPMVYFNGEIG